MSHRKDIFIELRSENKIVRSSVGNKYSYELRKSCFKQMSELKNHRLYPINTVDILSYEEEDNKFQFEMPYLNYEKPTEHMVSNRLVFQLSIINSLTNRMNRTQFGFIKACIDYLNDRIDELARKEFKDQGLFLAQKILFMIEKSEDSYPHGYAHGDFSFSNMLVSPNEELFITNFDYSFIYSPLLDIASLALSQRFEGHNDPFQKKVVERVTSHFLAHKNKIRVLKCLIMFNWLVESNNEDFRAEIIKAIDDE